MCLPLDQASLWVSCDRLHDSMGAVADPDDVEDASSQTEDVSEQEGTNGGTGSAAASAQPGDISMADVDPSPEVPGDHTPIVQLFVCDSKGKCVMRPDSGLPALRRAQPLRWLLRTICTLGMQS
jgi:hypothetical protein